MKRFLLTIVFALTGSIAFCQDKIVIPLDKKDVRTRSTVTLPEASICGTYAHRFTDLIFKIHKL